MINSVQSTPNLFASSRAQAPKATEAKAEASQAAAASATVADEASINFDASPLSTKAMSLLSATSAEAAALEGNLGEHVPGEVIIKTKPGTTLSFDQGSLVEDFGAKVLYEFDTPEGIHKSETGEFLHLKLPEGVSVAEAVAAMRKDGRVAFVEPNHTYGLPEVIPGSVPEMTSEAITNDPDIGKLWGLNNTGQTGGTADADIDAPEAWAVHKGLNQAQGGEMLFVIDTGIDYNHKDLAGNMWSNPGETGNGKDNDGNGVVGDIHGYNAYDNNGDPMDRHGHGSHCAGTIGAVGNNEIGVAGVNHNANIGAVKIFNDQGSTNAAAIIRGIQYTTKMGARITSNSWGGGAPNEGIKQAFAESPALHIAAAGNSGSNNDVRPHYPSNYDLPNMVAVAATDHNDNLARFSCYGENTVHIAAPGVDILSTVPGDKYASYSGTSMATPHVAGAALLIANANPGISNEDLIALLLDTVDQKDSLQGKVITGGRLNVGNALNPEGKSESVA